MKFAPILPPELYPRYDRGNYHMVQAHMIARNARMREWFRDRAQGGHTVILDNGVIELGEPDPNALLEVAREIHPTVVICPDAYTDATKTLSLFYSFAVACQRRSQHVMIVPHGKSVEEWLECAYTMLRMSARLLHNIPWIGVPKVLDSFETNGRLNALNGLRQQQGTVNVHLLGIWNGLLDVGQEFLEHDVMGIDSTLPGAAALHGEKLWRTALDKHQMPKDKWSMTEYDATPEERCLLRHNIQTTRDYLQKLAVPTVEIAHFATAS